MPDSSVEPGALAEQFIDVSRRIGRGSRRAQLGPLSVARYDVLHTLFHHDDLVMGQLAARLGIAARSATDLVAGLEADGYLRRTPHRGDRRKTSLVVTDAGMEALLEARRERIAGSAAPFEALTERERATLAALLAKVAAAAGEPAATPPQTRPPQTRPPQTRSTIDSTAGNSGPGRTTKSGRGGSS